MYPLDEISALPKLQPKSEGIETPRKKRPRAIAVITECCTGCAGSPACVPYCPVADCMFWVPDEDHPPFGHIEVDPFLCIGCKKCTSQGPDGAFLDGCPWDAIEMQTIDVRLDSLAGIRRNLRWISQTGSAADGTNGEICLLSNFLGEHRVFY